MINFDDIENAFLYVSADQPFMNSAVINRKTGKTYYHSEIAGRDEFPDDVDSEDYIGIPHKNDLDLGRDLVFDFVSNNLPAKEAEIYQIFRNRGAYRRFKALLSSLNLLDKWYEFENERTKNALLQWCKENDLEIKD